MGEVENASEVLRQVRPRGVEPGTGNVGVQVAAGAVGPEEQPTRPHSSSRDRAPGYCFSKHFSAAAAGLMQGGDSRPLKSSFADSFAVLRKRVA